MVTTAALVLLIAVLLVAAYARLWIAIATAVAAMFVFNFFFLDPVGTLTIADPQNLVAFMAFVTAALVASQLSATAKNRAQEALTSRGQLELLKRQADFTSTLLASLSHDLRTPITAIRVAVSNLDDQSLDAQARSEQVRLAQAELSRLSRLFGDILEMARIDSESLTPEREWVTASDIVDAALANLQPLLSDRPLTIDADETTAAFVDPRLTSSALLHLVENAAQYSPAGSPIEVRGFVNENDLRLSVTDRGPGLDPEEVPRLFDRFFRGRREQTRPAGTGMGLAITRGLLAVQNGRVWAENLAGGGAQFSIAIPAERRPVPAEA
jgi:two-component system sensor histidine kinase KdpD